MVKSNDTSLDEEAKLIAAFEDWLARLDLARYKISPAAYLAELPRFRAWLKKTLTWETPALIGEERYAEFRRRARDINNFAIKAAEFANAQEVVTQSVHKADLGVEDLISKAEILDRYANKVTDLDPFDLDRIESMAIVGSGSFPETLMFLKENTDIPRLTGLEIHPEATCMAIEVVREIDPDRRIAIHNIAGEAYDYAQTYAAHIVCFVPNKIEVLEQIARTAPDHIQINVINCCTPAMTFLFDDIERDLPPEFEITGKQRSRARDIEKEVLTLRLRR